jgi:hypothetical protein
MKENCSTAGYQGYACREREKTKQNKKQKTKTKCIVNNKKNRFVAFHNYNGVESRFFSIRPLESNPISGLRSAPNG